MPILPRANHGPAPAGLSLLQGAVRNRSTAAPDAHRERNGARLLQIFCGAGSRHCRPGIVDFCIVSPVVREADEQVRAQQARLAVVFANTSASAALWSFRCDDIRCTEGWSRLTQKTYAMLGAALTWTPRWRSLVKLDRDAFLCLGALAADASLMSRLEVTYAGILTAAPRLSWNASSKYYDPKAAALAAAGLAFAPYMQGCAYLLGRTLADSVAREPLGSPRRVALLWEDASLGMWVQSARKRVVNLLKRSPGERAWHTCQPRPGGLVYHHCRGALEIGALCGGGGSRR